MKIDDPFPPAKILIVDDRPENLVALEATLEPLAATVIKANSGAEALKQVLLHDFAVILLDVQMPGMSGFDTAQLIKSRERSRHIPIIFLTAISKEDEYVFEGYTAGAVDYMFKPFNPVILRSKVAAFVEIHRKNEQLRRQTELLQESERREAELRHRASLLESEARYAEVVNGATDAIVGLDAEGRITLFNPAAEQIFRCTQEEAIGQPVDDFFFPSLRPEHGWVAEQGTDGVEIEGVRCDGERFPVEFSIARADDNQGSETIFLRDITERRRAEEALRHQTASLAQTMEELRALNEELSFRTAELERAMGSRSRFYANMSHELRTPINAILGYGSLLLDGIYGPLNESQVRGIERSHKAAHHLLELVNDVLDLSKIEAGRVELQLSRVSFPSLIEDLFITVTPFAETHGVALTLEMQSEPFEITSDGRRIRQILLNLLSNAIKFGNGQPVSVVCVQEDGCGLHVEVSDQGPGIAPEEQERIFDEFVQLGQPEEASGTGLGLPISRGLAGLLGGSLTLESEVGSGSTFTLRLPSVPPAPVRLLSEMGNEDALEPAPEEATR